MAVAVPRAGRRQPSTRVTLLVGVPVAVGTGCWAYTRDFRAGWLESWPPPRRVGVVGPWDPVVDCLPLLLTVLGALVVVAGALMWRHPDARPTWLVRSWWRRYARYQWRWRKAMRLGGFTARMDDRVLVPRIAKVRCNHFVDRVLVKGLSMQETDDYTKWAESFAETFDALRCTFTRAPGGNRWWLEFLRVDPLAVDVPALPIPRAEDVDLTAVPIGVFEDGSPWTVPLSGGHVLVGGETKAGKSGVLWALLRGVAPLVQSGVVQVYACDPKDGIELGLSEELFKRFIPHDPDLLEAMLADLLAEKARRAKLIQGLNRSIKPSVETPLILLIIDELAAVLDDANREQAGRIMRMLKVLLQQGRAFSICVVGALQEPLKSEVKIRGLFPHRIAMRFAESTYADAVLGSGMRARGAACDGPLCELPGTGFVRVEGNINPRRGRVAYVADEDIRTMAVAYAPVSRAAVSELQQAAAPVQPKAGKRRKPGAAKTLMTGPVPLTPAQQERHDDMIARWIEPVREAMFTITRTPSGSNNPKARNKFSMDREKQELQREMHTALMGLGLDMPIRKTGTLVATITFRFATRHARELPNFEGPAKKALGDALRRYMSAPKNGSGGPPKWMLDEGYVPGDPRWIDNDTDAELEFMPAAISGGRGEPATTVRLTWREPA